MLMSVRAIIDIPRYEVVASLFYGRNFFGKSNSLAHLWSLSLEEQFYWEEQGIWLKVWRVFLSELNERQQLKWSESFLDGNFAPAKKGAAESEKPSGARGRSGWWWSTAAVFLWESTFTLHPRRKSGSRIRRSRRSG
jgi:hypothetical protein